MGGFEPPPPGRAAARVRRVAAIVRCLKAHDLPRELRAKLWPFFGRGAQPLTSRRYLGYPFVEVQFLPGEWDRAPEGFAEPYGPPPFLEPEW